MKLAPMSERKSAMKTRVDSTGRNSSLWPGYTFVFRKRMAEIRPDEYDIRKPLPVTRAQVAAAA